MAKKKTYRVSIKGVVPSGGRVLLVRKPNRTWDLPGGRLEDGEHVADCLIREVFEETGLTVSVGPILASWVRIRRRKPDVFTVAYLCDAARPFESVSLSDEHIGAALFGADEIAHLRMVEACRQAAVAALEYMS